MKIRKQFTCPLELTLDMISGKWKPIIIWRLRLGKQQLSKLNKDIQGINQKMLIQHLSELIECGIVNRTAYDGYPLKVEYDLTNTGRKFLEGLKIFQELGKEYLDADHSEADAIHLSTNTNY